MHTIGARSLPAIMPGGSRRAITFPVSSCETCAPSTLVNPQSPIMRCSAWARAASPPVGAGTRDRAIWRESVVSAEWCTRCTAPVSRVIQVLLSMPDDLTRSPAARKASWRPGPNLIALSLVSFFTDASSEIIAPLLPLFLVGTLGASVAFVGIIEGAAESVASLLKLGSGWWSDRLGRRKPLILAGYALASFMRPLMAIAATPAQVLGIRIADRAGKGVRASPRDALLAASVAPEERGRAFGFHRASDHAGAVVGPLIAIVCLQWLHMPLRQVFWVAAVPGALSVLVVI